MVVHVVHSPKFLVHTFILFNDPKKHSAEPSWVDV